MPTETDSIRLPVQELANRFRGEMIPLSNTFSYFAAMPIPEVTGMEPVDTVASVES